MIRRDGIMGQHRACRRETSSNEESITYKHAIVFKLLIIRLRKSISDRHHRFSNSWMLECWLTSVNNTGLF